MSLREVLTTCISTIAIALCIASSVTQVTAQKSISLSSTVIDSSDNLTTPLQEPGTSLTESRPGCGQDTTTVGGACTQTIGYWRYHPSHLFDILEIGPIDIGDRTITTVSQAREVLDQTSTIDARVMLRAQLLASMLNRANGSNAMAAGFDADAYIAQGQSFLATHPNPVLSGDPDREQALLLRDSFNAFNTAQCRNNECDDFVTGGGWIVRPNNARANFGVHGGIKNGEFWGGLNYLDHGTGLHVKSTGVTGYTVVSANRRRINYNVSIDGVPGGTAVVEVQDDGEPGRDDWFQIQLSNGYFASGDLGGPNPGGGNIQLHRRSASCPQQPQLPPAPANCGRVTIIKEVQTPGGGTSSTTSFSFVANERFGRTSFDLVDDDGGPGDDSETSNPIRAFGPANSITVTEQLVSGWSLADIVCVESVTTNSTVDVGTRTATIVVDPGESVVCTFRNTQFTPSAAPASVSGRVLDSYGNGIGGAALVMSDTQNGTTWAAVTNAFGYYTIEGPEVGNFYMITVNHKRFSFADDIRTFSLNDNISGMDFIANP